MTGFYMKYYSGIKSVKVEFENKQLEVAIVSFLEIQYFDNFGEVVVKTSTTRYY